MKGDSKLRKKGINVLMFELLPIYEQICYNNHIL